MTTLSIRVEVEVDDRDISLDALRTDLARRARWAVEASPYVTSVRHSATVRRRNPTGDNPL